MRISVSEGEERVRVKWLGCGGVILWLAMPTGWAATINHSHVAAASSLPAAYSSQIATQKWLFTHASVGGNMVEGMAALHASNPTRYPLQVRSDVGTAGAEGGSDYRASAAPVSTMPGSIYECQRGNPGWQNKLVCFSNSLVRSGWGSNKVDVAMDKFCWIDPDANSSAYCQTMARLEERFPDVRFVYTTLPLTGLADSENNARNGYNRAVRSYCAANGKLLFDVADMQAWSPQNVQQTYVSGSQTNQRMYSGYAVSPSGEDWHLNAAGRQRLALGWYAVAASLIQTNRQQFFTFRAVALTNSIVLRWPNPVLCGLQTSNVLVRCAATNYPATTNDGEVVYSGSATSFTHEPLTPGQAYYYTIWVSQDGTHFIEPP